MSNADVRGISTSELQVVEETCESLVNVISQNSSSSSSYPYRQNSSSSTYPYLKANPDFACFPRRLSSLSSSFSFRKQSFRSPAELVSSGSNPTESNERLTRACRVRVNIVGAKDLRRKALGPDPKVAVLKLKVEHHVRLSQESVRESTGCLSFSSSCYDASTEIIKPQRQERQIRIGGVEDGFVKINQSFTFDIKDPEHAVLSACVVARSRFGGDESLGVCSDVPISNLLEDHYDDLDAHDGDVHAQWYNLFAKGGRKPMPGKLLMHIVACIAEPEQKISLFLGTWNVGNARPPKDMSTWLTVNESHEIVVIGAQECEYQPRQPFSECAKDWVNSLKNSIGLRYKLICATSRSQIRLAAFVREDAEKAVSEIDSGSEATGVGHVVANKGAVCISFKFWDTDLCFVNCHLAAHVGYCDVRNSNYKEIVGHLSVGYQGMDILSKFHHVFWMGDLNYRLDFGDAEDKFTSPHKPLWQKIVDKIDTGDFEELLQHDELLKEKAAEKVFYGFKEGEIQFAPTFKMERNCLKAYDEKRIPAWCDRILWRSFEGCHVEARSYFSVPEISTSDHKPVGAVVCLTAYALPSSTTNEDGKRWHLNFTTLQATNLPASDINGFSDPYVSFSGGNLLHEAHSRVKYRTLNPIWDPVKDLPKLVLSSSSLQRVEKEYLLCHVLDYDYTSANDTLGYGTLALGRAVAAYRRNPEESSYFKIELLHKGLPAGVLQGGIKLTWEKCLSKQRSNIAGDFVVRTLTFRKSLKRTFFSKVLLH